MKRHPFTILLATAGIIALISACYVAFQQKPDDESKLKIMIDSLVDRTFGPSPTVSATTESGAPPFLVREAGSTTVRGNGFTLDVPASWIVGDVGSDVREEDGRLQYGWMANREPQAMDAGEDLVLVAVYDVLKDDDHSYAGIVEDHAWDATDVRNIVSFMTSELGEMYPDFSEADVRTEVTDETIADEPVKKAMLQCLKPCYVEGGATTSVYYFVDAPDRVYLIYVSAAYSELGETLLAEADAVAKTFRVNP